MTTTDKLETSPGTCAGHTPGPWGLEYMQRNLGLYITGPDGGFVARVTDAHNREANARLIAAAPAMLEALRGLFAQCVMVHKHWGGSDNKAQADAAIAAARAAIATATGNGGEA